MIKVKFVKFYQAVQIGPEAHSYLGGPTSKVKDAIMTFENGLLRVESARFDCVVYAPFSNIMYFHELTEEKQAKRAKSA